MQLANEIESEDPIDWGMLAVDEMTAYRLIASGLVEEYLPKYNDPHIRDIMMASLIKLVVENFTLNLKLRDQL